MIPWGFSKLEPVELSRFSQSFCLSCRGLALFLRFGAAFLMWPQPYVRDRASAQGFGLRVPGCECIGIQDLVFEVADLCGL